MGCLEDDKNNIIETYALAKSRTNKIELKYLSYFYYYNWCDLFGTSYLKGSKNDWS